MKSILNPIRPRVTQKMTLKVKPKIPVKMTQKLVIIPKLRLLIVMESLIVMLEMVPDQIASLK